MRLAAGDWCAVEARASCTPGTGPQAAAASWVLALRAMGEMATAIGEAADAAAYAARLAAAQKAYDAAYWNASAGGHVGGRPPLEHQTLASISLGSNSSPRVPGRKDTVCWRGVHAMARSNRTNRPTPWSTGDLEV